MASVVTFRNACIALILGASGLAGCATAPSGGFGGYSHLSQRDCLARVMYFESNRSSTDGMIAVGTVVMNRKESGRYPGSVCGVVGQRNQFAPGVLSKPVGGRSWQLALSKADDVLAGERHPRVARAMHFHTAGYTFPYRNMAYVVAAGGNVFYEKRTPGTFTPVNPNVLVAQAQHRRPSDAILLARAETPEPAAARSHAPERTRLAMAEPRPARHGASHVTQERPVLISREHFQPASRDKLLLASRDKPSQSERVRLAHLNDDDLPKALRHRSDEGPAGGSPLAYKPSAGGSPARTAAARIEPPKARAGSPAPARLAAKPDLPRDVPANKAANAAPARGELLAYRGVKAKADTTASLAKMGWKRGPDPASSRDKKRP